MTEAKEGLERQGPKKRVLVVDDQQSLRSVLGKMLTKAGYDVILVAHGAEASRLWRENGPDLVIVDLFMPEKDGIETILELRANTPGIPIIAMSGGGTFQQVGVLQAARLLGAVATISKPFDNQTMIDLVARSLAGV